MRRQAVKAQTKPSYAFAETQHRSNVGVNGIGWTFTFKITSPTDPPSNTISSTTELKGKKIRVTKNE
jgi:hypothetical protein